MKTWPAKLNVSVLCRYTVTFFRFSKGMWTTGWIHPIFFLIQFKPLTIKTGQSFSSLLQSPKLYLMREDRFELITDYRPAGRTSRRIEIPRTDARISLSWSLAENRQYDLVYRHLQQWMAWPPQLFRCRFEVRRPWSLDRLGASSAVWSASSGGK